MSLLARSLLVIALALFAIAHVSGRLHDDGLVGRAETDGSYPHAARRLNPNAVLLPCMSQLLARNGPSRDAGRSSLIEVKQTKSVHFLALSIPVGPFLMLP
jgi:hypothetical protein